MAYNAVRIFYLCFAVPGMASGESRAYPQVAGGYDDGTRVLYLRSHAVLLCGIALVLLAAAKDAWRSYKEGPQNIPGTAKSKSPVMTRQDKKARPKLISFATARPIASNTTPK